MATLRKVHSAVCLISTQKYLDTSPRSLYIKAEPGRGRYTPTEVEALKNRIEQLEQMVGKLTLENDLLKRGMHT